MKWLVLAVNDECADWLRVCDVDFHDFSTDSLGIASRFEQLVRHLIPFTRLVVNTAASAVNA